MKLKKLRLTKKALFFSRIFSLLAIFATFILIGLEVLIATGFNTVTQNKIFALDKPTTFLFIGGDSGGTTRLVGDNWTPLADTMILATINPKNLNGNIELNALSIPRDTRMNITCVGDSDKANKALSYGYNKKQSLQDGIDCTKSSIEEMFDITIDNYVYTSFDGIISAVDAVDGIDVDVPYEFCTLDENDVEDNVCFEKGKQKLNGSQALAYARQRHAINPELGTSGDDWERNIRQQEVIAGLSKKALSNPTGYISGLLSTVNKEMITNLDISKMTEFANFGVTTYNNFVDSIGQHYTSNLILKRSEYSRLLGINPYEDILGLKVETDYNKTLDDLYDNQKTEFINYYKKTDLSPIHIDYRALNLPSTNEKATPFSDIEFSMSTLDTIPIEDGSGDEELTKDAKKYYSEFLKAAITSSKEK